MISALNAHSARYSTRAFSNCSALERTVWSIALRQPMSTGPRFSSRDNLEHTFNRNARLDCIRFWTWQALGVFTELTHALLRSLIR